MFKCLARGHVNCRCSLSVRPLIQGFKPATVRSPLLSCRRVSVMLVWFHSGGHTEATCPLFPAFKDWKTSERRSKFKTFLHLKPELQRPSSKVRRRSPLMSQRAGNHYDTLPDVINYIFSDNESCFMQRFTVFCDVTLVGQDHDMFGFDKLWEVTWLFPDML